MSTNQNPPPKRPRLSLQIKAISSGPNLRASRTIAAVVNPTSPTSFNTLSNVYATAIDRATPVTAINTRQSLKIQTQNLTQSQQHGTQTPYASTYLETPLTAQPISPAVASLQDIPFPSTMTATPPLSAGPVDSNDANPFSFSAVDTASATTPSASLPAFSFSSSASSTTVSTPSSSNAGGGVAGAGAGAGAAARRRTTAPLNLSNQGIHLPYNRNRSLHSILRNSPLPPPTAKTPISPRRQSVRLAEKAARRVGYESPIERVITTNEYVRSHIDLLTDNLSPSSAGSAPSPSTATASTPTMAALDVAMADNETRDGGQTPGPFEEMRRRMAGLVTRTPTSPSSSSSPAGIRKRRRKDRGRRWVWTIGTQEDDEEDDAEVGGAIAATRAAASRTQSGGGGSSSAAATPTAATATSSAGGGRAAVTLPPLMIQPVVQSPMEIPTPSIETFDEAESAAAGVDVVMSESEAEVEVETVRMDGEKERRVGSLLPGDMDVDMITPTIARKNYLDPRRSRSVTQESDGLFNSETGSRRDTPIPADLVPTQ